MVANGHSNNEQVVSQYKRTTFQAGVILPDAPVGEWEATVMADKTTIKPTSAGDPMVTFTLRLDTAADPENEFAQGTQLRKMFVLGGDRSKLPAFAKRNTKLDLRALAAQGSFDLDIIPDELVTAAEEELSGEEIQNIVETRLRPLVDAVEGRTFTIWTTHRDDKRNPGQKQVDIHFSKPGSQYGAPQGLSSRDEE